MMEALVGPGCLVRSSQITMNYEGDVGTQCCDKGMTKQSVLVSRNLSEI